MQDVVVDGSATLHGRHDGGEVVVGQHHVARLLGHLGAGDAHGHADLGLLERGRIVDPVAGHGCDLAVGLQRSDDADLVLRRHPGTNPDRLDPPGELVVVHGIDIGAGHDLAFDSQLTCDRPRGGGMVASDHAHADAGVVALLDGGDRFGASRVEDADESLQGELDHLVGQLAFVLRSAHRQAAAGHRQDAQTPRPEIVVAPNQLGAPILVEDRLRIAKSDPPASRHHHVGRTLDRHHRSTRLVGIRVQGGHELRRRVEGHLSRACAPCPFGLGIQAGLAGQHDQRALGGIAHKLGRAPLRGPQVGVVAEHRQPQCAAEPCRLCLVDERAGGRHCDRALGTVAKSFDHEVRPAHDQPGGGHLVERERAGLVRADRSGGSEGLDRGQPPDDGVVLGHARHPDGERHGDHRGQTLGDGGHRQRHRFQRGVGEYLALGHRQPEHRQHRQTRDCRQSTGQHVELSLQWRLGILGRGQQAGETTDLGGHRCVGDQQLGASPDDGGVHVGAVGAIGCREATTVHPFDRQGIDALLGGHGFTREGGLLDRQVGGQQQTPVGRHPIPRYEDDHNAPNPLGGRHLQDLAVALHPDHELEHGSQRCQRLVGPTLLHIPQDRVDEQDHHDHDRVLEITDRGREDRSPHEDVGQHVAELVEEAQPARTPLRLGKTVGPVLLHAPVHLVGAEAPGRVHLQPLGRLIR